jgi:hypothetical protein
MNKDKDKTRIRPAGVSSISTGEHNRREKAVNAARASVGLEGFKISKEDEAQAQRFINGEIELPDFLKVTKERKLTIDEYHALSKEKREEIFRRGTKAAIAQTHALGLPTTHGDGKGIYKLYPDGHKEYTKLYTKEELDD